MKSPSKPLGERCRDARTSAGLTQEDAAFELRRLLPKARTPGGSVISRIESGKIQKPEPYVIAALAEAYGVDIVDLAPEMSEEVAMLAQLLSRCAPRDLNPEPADYNYLHADAAKLAVSAT